MLNIALLRAHPAQQTSQSLPNDGFDNKAQEQHRGKLDENTEQGLSAKAFRSPRVVLTFLLSSQSSKRENYQCNNAGRRLSRNWMFNGSIIRCFIFADTAFLLGGAEQHRGT